MVNSASSALSIQPARKITSLSSTLALANLEDVCRQIQNLDDLYSARRTELLTERNAMIMDAADARISIRQIQHITNISRNRIYQIRAAGSNE